MTEKYLENGFDGMEFRSEKVRKGAVGRVPARLRVVPSRFSNPLRRISRLSSLLIKMRPGRREG